MKRICLIFLVFSLLLTGLTGCSKEEEQSDALKFKEEYEALNGSSDEDGNVYVDITIDEDNTIRYVDIEGIIEAFGNGTHVIYLGWPSCGWCRRMLPVLIDTVNQYSGIYIYYYSIEEIREAYEDDPESELGQQYKVLVDEINRDDFDLSEYVSYYDDGTMKLPSSLVYFIKEGEIVGVHKRTVDTHIDAYEPLSDEQTEELSSIYSWYLDEMIREVDVGCNSCD